MSSLTQKIDHAYQNRLALIDTLHAEGTNCYRLFHGASEGYPGLTIDRYGSQVLLQNFHQVLAEEQLNEIKTQLGKQLEFDADIIYNDRSGKNSRYHNRLEQTESIIAYTPSICTELGIHYRSQSRHQGSDPLLFLDFRIARRWIRENAANLNVLNTFSYTCGIGIAAAIGGAEKVTNIDFASSALNYGKENQQLNSLEDNTIEFIKSDFFPAIRQLAGLPIKSRNKPPPYQRMEEQHFDIVVLDPPRWAKSPFGTVDLIRDYPSLLKPCILATKENGRILCTNNVAKVDIKDWLDIISRCAEKVGRPIKKIKLLLPEADFPSHDNKPPLKIAILQF